VLKAKEDLGIGLTGARKEDLDAKRAEIRALEAAVASAKNQLDYSTLLAPFDGHVSARFVDNFQTVQPKQAIVRLLDISKIEVTIQVPESLISLVPQVKKAVCQFDVFPGRTFVGRVTKVGGEASQTTRTYPVTVEIDRPADVKILPGMAARIRAAADKTSGAGPAELVVPPAAIFTREAGQQSYVWVVQEGSAAKVTQRAVKTGRLTLVGIVVTEGLKPGERVVAAGVNSLRENQEVRVLQEGQEP
ncbi:MAG TPA: efflux RND transporter periplasmic adaptor subunit, partial [Bradyrhizobium sp.]|nr:efflux RND transporter periplasmic adaptor subunit [Bradyrhizobium sp.]